MAVEGVGSRRLKRGIGELGESRSANTNSINNVDSCYVLEQDVKVVDNCRYSIIVLLV